MSFSIHIAINSHGEDQEYITEPFKTQFAHKLHMMFLSGTNSYNWAPIARPVMTQLQEQYKNNKPTDYIMTEFKKECLRAYETFGIEKIEQLTKESLDEKSNMPEEVKKVIKRASANLKKTPIGEIDEHDRICYRSGAVLNRLYTFTPLDYFKKVDEAVDSYGVSIKGKSFAGGIMVLRVGINGINVNTPFNLIGNEVIPLLEKARQKIRETLYYNQGQIKLTDILKHLNVFDKIYIYDLGCRATKTLVRSTTTVFSEEKESGKLLKPLTTDSLSESDVALHVDVTILLELIDLTKLITDDLFFSDIHDQVNQYKIEAMNGRLTEESIQAQIERLKVERQSKMALLDTYHTLTSMKSNNSSLDSIIDSLKFDTTRKNIEMSITKLYKIKEIIKFIQLKNDYCQGAFFKENKESMCDDTFINTIIENTPFSYNSQELNYKMEDFEIYLKAKKKLLDELKQTAAYFDDEELHEFIKDIDSKTREEIEEMIDSYGAQIVEDREVYSDSDSGKRKKRNTRKRKPTRQKKSKKKNTVFCEKAV